MNTKHKGLYMKFAVAVIILQTIVYTWVHLYLSSKAGVEIAPITSCAFYTFCIGELSVCGMIKSSKGGCKDEQHTETVG